MKTLLLLRHAKSSWKDSDIADHDRPLNKRGKREAPRMGRLLREENLLPDLIVSSSARRCRKTAEHIIQSSGYRGETRITNDLYEATGEKLHAFLQSTSPGISRLLLIAHNPGVEELLEMLAGIYTPMTTAALAHLELGIEHWSDLTSDTRGKLVHSWQPRELD